MKKINSDSIILFHDVFEDEIIQKAIRLINSISQEGDISSFERDYFLIQRLLLEQENGPCCNTTLWQGHIGKLLAQSENKFSLQSEKESLEDLYFKIALREITVIKYLYHYNWEETARCFNDHETSILSVKEKESENVRRKQLHDALSLNDDEASTRELSYLYSQNGCGLFEKFDAFIWNNGLIGIENYDMVRFEDLTGYELQKNVLIENTNFFVNGLKANNILLYGDKGTGKSSSVKALLNHFRSNKLKMIELSKENLSELTNIMEPMRNRGFKFIIFIDDLSFEEFETGYKHLKSVIEGGLEGQPDNILIYVTSNRRNLIRETWENQNGLNSDIHVNDFIQERLSLADRFGITITFPSPDKTLYLKIVKELAVKENLDISEEDLCAEALKWEMRYHGRSGRTARQFVNDLIARRLSNHIKM